MTLSLKAFCRLTDGVHASQLCLPLKATVSLMAAITGAQNVLVVRQ